jgi:hypothetical protein
MLNSTKTLPSDLTIPLSSYGLNAADRISLQRHPVFPTMTRSSPEIANDNLYVVIRTLFNANNLEQSFDVTVPAICANIQTAKKVAKMVLVNEGYNIESFAVYDVNHGFSKWKHDDDIVVYAEGPDGEVFKVEMRAITNMLKLRAGRFGRVLQTVIE